MWCQIAPVAKAGTFAVTVSNPSPGGGSATPLGFTVNNPIPKITKFNPASALAGAATFNLTVIGTNFVAGSVIAFNGTKETTHYTSATSLWCQIPATAIVKAGSYAVTVANPAPGGGSGAPLEFPVNNPLPKPAKLSPATVVAGAAAFKLTVTGTNFVSGAVIAFNGVRETTTFVSATTLSCTIPTVAVSKAGTFAVSVTNPAPGGGTGNALSFKVTAATAAHLSSASVQASTGAIYLTFDVVLDSDAATDSAHYTVSVNGRSVAVESVAYANRRITLGLPEGALHTGDVVNVEWQGLLDYKGNAVDGQIGPIAVR